MSPFQHTPAMIYIFNLTPYHTTKCSHRIKTCFYFFILSCTLILKVFPSPVYLCLELGYQIFISFFEKMFKSSLLSQEVFYRKFFLWFIRKYPLAVVYFKEWPIACFYGKFTDFHYHWCIISPSSWTWCHDI